MDPVSLAVGIIGLAGLFSTCLDSVEKVDNYKHFKNDEQALAAQFVSFRLRFEKWGKALGLNDQTALSEDQHEALVDADTLETVRKLIDIIREILSDRKGSTPNAIVNTSSLLKRSLTEPFRKSLGSKKEKLSWALKGKEKREAQVELFGKLVQHLYHLVPIDSITRTPTVNGIQPPTTTIQIDDSLTLEVLDTLQRLEGKAQADTRRELHAWLVRHPPNEIYEDAVQKRLDYTCDWIMERATWQDWLCSSQSPGTSRMLWIHGPAGFGKTILSARVIQHLETTSKAPVASFFFSSDFESRDDPYEAIRCWIWEIISRSQPAFDYVYMEREKLHGSAATRMFILSLLSEVVRLVPGCVFVIDGLDECTWLNKGSNTVRGDSIASFLEKLGQSVAKFDTRILIVSRDEPTIRSGFEAIKGAKFEYGIVSDDVLNDTKRYAKSIVETKLSKKNDSLKSSLAEKMAEKCGGQFLWLKLQEDSLRSWKNEKQLQEAIEKTPSGLDNLYHRNWVRLSQLPKDERDRAFSLFRWVTFAIRPLTVAEIAEAVLISFENEELPADELPDFIEDDFVSSEITGVLGSLVDIRKSSNELDLGLSTLRLTHFSVKQYFLSHDPISGDTLQANEKLRSSNEMAENITLAQFCLWYIHDKQIWKIDRDQDSTQVHGSFRDYAAGYWHRHAHNGSLEDEVIKSLVDSLFDTTNDVWGAWKSWFDSRERDRMESHINMDKDSGIQRRQTFSQSMPHSPLYYASRLDLTQVTLRLIQECRDCLNDKSYFGETALAAACINDNETISKALISAGASVASTNYSGKTPLHLTAEDGHTSLVRLLLENGAEPHAVDNRSATALHYATYEKSVEKVELLLQYGANSLAQDFEGIIPLHSAASHGLTDIAEVLIRQNAEGIHTESHWQQRPLHFAAINGKMEMARLLLDYGADLNAIDTNSCTALLDAAFFGFIDVVRLLLNKKPNLDAQDRWGRTALMCAAKNGYSEITQLLLGSGVDNTLCDESNWSALHHAAFEGSTDTVHVLLRNGADIMETTPSGRDPLLCAAESGQIEMVKFLLERGVDLLAAQRKERQTPLGGAIIMGHLEMTEFLLKSGVSYSAVLDSEWLPLTLASHWGQISIAKLLLGLGADLEGSTVNGMTPLLTAISNNKIDMVQFLLESGASTTATNDDGDAAMKCAIYEGNAEIVSLLLDNKVDFTVSDDQGWKPLNLAAHNGHIEIVKLLLERGSDVSDTDTDGWTPLHAAADGGHVDVFTFFLGKGVPHKALDCCGRTALHIACLKGHQNIVETLLELCTSDELCSSDNCQRTPLFYAAMRGHNHVLSLLLSKSSEIHTKDLYSSTALFAAVRNGHEEAVAQLLTCTGEISLDCQDGFGKTVSYWARKNNNVQIIELLSQIGCIQCADEVDSVPEQTHRPFDSEAYWCDVCTRCINGKFFECSCGGDFIACQECVTMGAKCLDKSHMWTAAQIDSSNSSSSGEEECGELLK